jgi:hypothetical protein
VNAGEPLREIALSYAVDHSTISLSRRGTRPSLIDPRGVGSPGVSVPPAGAGLEF